jgi:hypothetical protein
MTLFIGTDEAGYGPNLGPLVIGATAWRVPDAADLDLYQRLVGIVSRVPDERTIAIADSKQLYKAGGGLRALERGVFASLSTLNLEALTWRQFWSQTVPCLAPDVMAAPWHCEYDEPLPIDSSLGQLSAEFDQFRAGLDRAQVQLQAVEADAVFPHEFNRLVAENGSKGAVLSQRTVRLVRRVWESTKEATTLVQCDKHGGRNCYLPVLQTSFPEYLVEVVRESQATSVYRWGPPTGRVEFRFSAKGESFLPAALASMFAKYLRELAMRAFNAFWQAQAVGLKPTAGYPVDARRFIQEIAAKQRELAIDRELLWRCR